MNAIKKYLGMVWILLAPATMIFLFVEALEKTREAAQGIDRINTALQWGIILFIFLPICAGLAIFGYYALQNEYQRLPSENED